MSSIRDYQYRDFEEKTFSTRDGELSFRRYLYHPRESLTIKASADVTYTAPLPFHVRVLVDLFGYDTVRTALENLPQQLREQTEVSAHE